MAEEFDLGYIRYLAHRWEQGLLTEGELADWERWEATHADERLELPQGASDPEAIKARLYEGLLQRIPIGKPRYRPLLRRWIPYAAAVALIFALATGYFLLDTRQQTLDNRLTATEILPGGNRATLTLADGRVVELSEAHSGVVIGDSSVSYQDGSSILEARDKNQESRDGHVGSLASGILSLASITTPKGGTYQVTLSDGSRVWLNASSTLKYPSRFDSDERVVKLEGEAYFEVRRENRHAGQHGDVKLGGVKSNISHLTSHLPFRVMTKGQVVEVLGTEFNISAYPEDKETKTTLVEGSVKVFHPLALDRKYVLIPGQQATVLDTQVGIANVNIDQYTAWLQGDIVFDQTELPQIFRQLERWYDVQFDVGSLSLQGQLNGKLSRKANLSEILRVIERNTDLKFIIEAPVGGERRVRVYR